MLEGTRFLTAKTEIETISFNGLSFKNNLKGKRIFKIAP